MLCTEQTNVFFSHCRGPRQVGPCQSQTFRRSDVSHCCSFGWLKSTTRHKQPPNPRASEGQGHSRPYPIFLQDPAAVGRGGAAPNRRGSRQSRTELGTQRLRGIGQHTAPLAFSISGTALGSLSCEQRDSFRHLSLVLSLSLCAHFRNCHISDLTQI